MSHHAEFMPVTMIVVGVLIALAMWWWNNRRWM
jgi:hypothetical protein